MEDLGIRKPLTVLNCAPRRARPGSRLPAAICGRSPPKRTLQTRYVEAAPRVAVELEIVTILVVPSPNPSRPVPKVNVFAPAITWRRVTLPGISLHEILASLTLPKFGQ
jgi:hypothetical protein